MTYYTGTWASRVSGEGKLDSHGKDEHTRRNGKRTGDKPGFRFRGLGFRVWGLGFRVPLPGMDTTICGTHWIRCCGTQCQDGEPDCKHQGTHMRVEKCNCLSVSNSLYR